MASVLETELAEVVPELPAHPFEELDDNRISVSIVYEAPQIFDLNIVCLVPKNIYIEKSLIFHNDKRSLKLCVSVCYVNRDQA